MRYLKRTAHTVGRPNYNTGNYRQDEISLQYYTYVWM